VRGGGYPTKTGTIKKIQIAMTYHRIGTYTDDKIRLRYRISTTYGTTITDYTDAPTDTTVYTDITADTNANGGSWDWTDITNLNTEATFVKTGSLDNIDWYIDTLHTTICHT